MKLRGLIDKAIRTNITTKVKVVILLILFLILFKPSVVETIGQRFRCVFYAATDVRSFYLNLTTPRAGEYVLPSAVQEMLTLLRSHQIVSYRISEKIMNDPLLHQRIVESAWPLKMSSESNYKFVLISELDHLPDCRETDRRKEVALVFCR